MDATEGFLFIDQLKIMGYGESDTSGCWIKFQLTPELLEVVRGRKGEMVEVAARLIDNAGEYIQPELKEDPPGDHGKFWAKLIAYGTFNAPPVLKQIGSDAEFRAWIQRQPSCISHNADWDEEAGEPRCEAAHVRRVEGGAGTAIKPEYACVPLTHEEHAEQHQKGEHDREWFEKQAAKYRYEWASATLAKKHGFERRRDCPPDVIVGWFERRDLWRFLPPTIEK